MADLVAHTIDIDSMAVGEPAPDHEPNWDQLPHVKGPSNQFTERGVDFRRGTPPAALLEQMLSAANNLSDFLLTQSPTINHSLGQRRGGKRTVPLHAGIRYLGP